MKRYTRDDTVHGDQYYRADEVDALLAKQQTQPVAVVEQSDFIAFGEPRRNAVRELYAGALKLGDKLYTQSAQQAQPDRTGCTAGSDEECTNRHCATNCPALAGRPAQPGDALFRQFLAEAGKAGITHLKIEQPAEPTDQAAEWMAVASSAVLALNDAASWLPDGQNKRTVALSAEHIQKRARALYTSTQQPGGIYTGLDSARLNWLNSNFFSDEKSDWDQRQTPNCHKWKFFAPNTVQGDIRRVIDVAILAEQIAANKNGGE